MPKSENPFDNPLYIAAIDTMHKAAVGWLLMHPNAKLAFRSFPVEVIAALEPAVIKLYGLSPDARELLGVMEEASKQQGTLSQARAVIAALADKGMIRVEKGYDPNAN